MSEGQSRRIEVVAYCAAWPSSFAAEKDLIENFIPIGDMQIYHIGSTAVPMLAAKPVIDILLVTDDVSKLDDCAGAFEKINYTCKGEFGIPGRRYYQKGGHLRSHQIHAFSGGAERVTKFLAFKHYLINHPEIATEYAALKIAAAFNCAHDINKYSQLKQEFIAHHEPLAIAWYQPKTRVSP